SICDGQSYTFGSQTLTTGGTYTNTVTAANGCDSVVTLNLTVIPNSSSSMDASICDGQSYTFGSQTLTTGGTYTNTVTTANGCDSMVTLNLTVLPNSSSSMDASICDGQSYTFGSQTLTTGGTYTNTVTAANGCDSVITLTLQVNPISNTNLNAEICQGSTYNFGSQSITTSGTYTLNLTNINGCDSIVNLELLVNPTYAQSIQASILFGNSYAFNGQNLTSPGTYTANLLTVKGCDSIITLNLNVLAQSGVSIANATTCQGDTVIVPVTINQGVGISAISLAINYNPAGLTFIGSQNINSSIASILIGTNNFGGLNQVRASWSDINPVSLSGTAFELKFLAQNNSSLQFDLANPGNCELADSVGNPIPQVTFTGGNVSVLLNSG
ncbi:MAG: cohesin domain-containing protein, partial [Bacteroidota bacterium]